MLIATHKHIHTLRRKVEVKGDNGQILVNLKHVRSNVSDEDCKELYNRVLQWKDCAPGALCGIYCEADERRYVAGVCWTAIVKSGAVATPRVVAYDIPTLPCTCIGIGLQQHNRYRVVKLSATMAYLGRILLCLVCKKTDLGDIYSASKYHRGCRQCSNCNGYKLMRVIFVRDAPLGALINNVLTPDNLAYHIIQASQTQIHIHFTLYA